MCFAATDLGVLAWTNTQKHFAQFAPPSADFVPAASEALETAVYDAETLKDLELEEFEAVLGQIARSTRRKDAVGR